MSDQTADQIALTGERGPWTIKSVHVETRKSAVASAAKLGLTIGEWLERAARAQVMIDQNNAVLPPAIARSQVFMTGFSGMTPPTVVTKPVIDLAHMVALLKTSEQLYDVAQALGAMPSGPARTEVAATLRFASKALNDAMRQARGAPPLKVRDRSGDTRSSHQKKPLLVLASASPATTLARLD